MLGNHPELNEVQREVAVGMQEEYNERVYNLLLRIWEHENQTIDSTISHTSFEIWEIIISSMFTWDDVNRLLKPVWHELIWYIEVEKFYHLFMKDKNYIELILSWKITLGYSSDYEHILVAKILDSEDLQENIQIN